MTRIVYLAEALRDVQDAFAWYEQQRRGLGDEFILELVRAEERILRSPTAFRVLHRETRRFSLHRFPYQLLYRVAGDVIVVVGCFHVRRSPRVTRERSDG